MPVEVEYKSNIPVFAVPLSRWFVVILLIQKQQISLCIAYITVVCCYFANTEVTCQCFHCIYPGGLLLFCFHFMFGLTVTVLVVYHYTLPFITGLPGLN